MKQILLLIGIFLSVSCSKSTHTGTIPSHNSSSTSVIDLSPTLQSQILGGEQHFAVYLPPSYATEPNKRYPVLYLLHGMNQNYKSWINEGALQAVADEVIAEGAKEMIIICPDGFNSFYYNRPQMRYEDFFIQEFIPEIERRYRILSEKSHRNIAGLSMGGFGATYLAFQYHNLFGNAYSTSGGFIEPAMSLLKGIINAKLPTQKNFFPSYTLECGEEDSLVIQSNRIFSQFLDEKQMHYTKIFRQGTHNWKFWKESLPKILRSVR